MSTAMVITTVITSDVDVEKVKTLTLEQIRNNDQGLINNLMDRGVDARITTAILNIDEFLDYIRIRRRKEPSKTLAKPSRTKARVEAVAPQVNTVVVTDNMSELEFMEYTLQQINNGKHATGVKMNQETLAVMEEEPIGESFSRQPFLY